MSDRCDETTDRRSGALAFGAVHVLVSMVSGCLLIGLPIFVPLWIFAKAFWADSPRTDPQTIFHVSLSLKFLWFISLYGVVGSIIAVIRKVRLPVYVAAAAYAVWLVFGVGSGQI